MRKLLYGMVILVFTVYFLFPEKEISDQALISSKGIQLEEYEESTQPRARPIEVQTFKKEQESNVKKESFESSYDEERVVLDAVEDLRWLEGEWTEFLDGVLKNELALSPDIITEFYSLQKQYTSQFKKTSDLIGKEVDVDANMRRLAWLHEKYLEQREAILGKENVKLISGKYVQEFNEKNSFIGQNGVVTVSF